MSILDDSHADCIHQIGPLESIKLTPLNIILLEVSLVGMAAAPHISTYKKMKQKKQE
jgi:hypothetical protein